MRVQVGLGLECVTGLSKLIKHQSDLDLIRNDDIPKAPKACVWIW